MKQNSTIEAIDRLTFDRASKIDAKSPFVEITRLKFFQRANDTLLLKILNDKDLCSVELIIELLDRWASFSQDSQSLPSLLSITSLSSLTD